MDRARDRPTSLFERKCESLHSIEDITNSCSGPHQFFGLVGFVSNFVGCGKGYSATARFPCAKAVLLKIARRIGRQAKILVAFQ